MNTSTFAEKSIQSIVGHIQKLVHVYLVENGPSIHQTIEEHFAGVYGPSTIRARCAELVRLGLVHDTGQRGRTRAGRPAIVWEACWIPTP